ncbi:hypothetical protein BJ165DRAFT_1527136 [Panaeolus papilionaceus]|nr:hypothetical protein BJ165DRAFT_1527136 [Panaeolus papilionaceus]
MESAYEAKMDALKQTIKNLREKRSQLERDLEAAQSDVKLNKTQYSRLDKQLQKEKSRRIKLEQNLRSLGVEVDQHGNINTHSISNAAKAAPLDQALSHSEAPPSPDRVKSEDIPALLPASPNTNTPLASDHPFGDTTPVDIKIKIKKGKKDDNYLALPPDVRARFLKGATLFPIDPDPLSVAVGRYALNMAYGAATVAMSWSKDDHKFLWPSYDWNPDMPRGPGEPGLLLEVHPIYCDDVRRTLFYKVRKANPALWAYAGQYVGRVAGKLWKEEYAALGDVVHVTRATQMLRDRSIPDSGSEWQRIKARIVIRKKFKLPPGTSPSEDQIQAELPNLALELSQEYPADYITCQDITDAFVRGDEHLVVSRLECVGYDHSKASEFMDVQKRYEEMKAAKAKKSKVDKQDRKRKGATPSSDSSDSEEDSPPPPTKRSKKTTELKPQALSSTATSLAPTPSSSRSVRIRVKSRKILELE